MIPCQHDCTLEWRHVYLVCSRCEETVGVRCATCDGSGYSRTDLARVEKLIWGPRGLLCPVCKGLGWVTAPAF